MSETKGVLEIYDPAMCCSTGVCGPSVDPELMRVAATINALQKEGATIKRYGLSSEPMAFMQCKAVNDLLLSEGAEVLPIVVLDGEVVKKGGYPSEEEFSLWTKKPLKPLFTLASGCSCGPEGCC